MIGDESLQARPMRRIIVPLERMGARIESRDGRPPLTVHGTQRRHAVGLSTPRCPAHRSRAPCCWPACTRTGGTSVTEAMPTRDHTERALAEFGVQVDAAGTWHGVHRRAGSG